MGRLSRIFVGAFALASVSSCLDPTEIVIEISTNIACSVVQANGVAIAIGASSDDRTSVTTVTRMCGGDGGVGSLVIVPSAANDDVGIRVMLGVDASAETCKAPGFDGCIVARRSLRYVPHTPLMLPIDLESSCIGVPCDPNSTCVNGSCVDAGVDCDGGSCNVVDAAPPVDAGCIDTKPTFITADALIDTPHIARTTSGYVVMWERMGSEAFLVALDGAGHLIAAPHHVAYLSSTAKLDAVASDGTSYLAVIEDPDLYGQAVAADGTLGATTPIAGTTGPLGGVFYDQNQYITVGVAQTNVQFLDMAPAGTTIGAVGLSGAQGPSVSLSGTTYYPSAYFTTGGCAVVECLGPAFQLKCKTYKKFTGCTGIRTAASSTRAVVATFNAGLATLDMLTTASTGPLSEGCSNGESFIPLATGSTFHFIVRDSGLLSTNTFPSTTQDPIDPSTSYTGTGAGFDAVADGPDVPGYAVVYWSGNASGQAGLYFTHRCQ